MFAIGIVAHESRRAQASTLANNVGADYLSVDDGARGCEGNHRHVWERLVGQDQYWSVVLEDDAVPVASFQDQLRRALDVAPTAVVSLYLGRSRPPQWQDRIARATDRANADDASWLTHQRLLHCVGVAIKTRHVPAMLAATANAGGPMGLPIDEAMASWTRRSGLGVAYTWPSLVDHADGPTVAYHRDRAPRDQERKAWSTGTRNRWSTRHVAI